MESVKPVFALKDAGYQISAALISTSVATYIGINYAFATIVLPAQLLVEVPDLGNSSINDTAYHVTSNDTGQDADMFAISKEEASWIASVVAMTTAVGGLLSGVVMDRWGRKVNSILASSLLIVAWAVTSATTTDITVLYIGRAIGGLGAGISCTGMVYVAEITHASIRSALLPLISVFLSFGILLTSVLGDVMPWRAVAMFNTVLAVFLTVLLLFIPESPVWLSKLAINETKREKKVLRSLQWLYRKKEFCDEEFSRLKDIQDRITATAQRRLSLSEALSSFEIAVRQFKKSWKPLFLLFVLFLFQQLTGCLVVIVYSLQIFQAAGSIDIDPWVSLIGLGVIRLVMASATVFLNVGRRTLLDVSGAGMSLSMLFGGLWLIFGDPSLVPVICILLFVLFSSFGYLIIPSALAGEILPAEIRGIASGLALFFCYFLTFVYSKIFFYIVDAIGMPYVLIGFGVFSAMSTVFVYFFIPETKGKTFEEIERSFR